MQDSSATEQSRQQLELDKAALAAERSRLEEREKAVTAREESCKASEEQNAKVLVNIKQREVELASSKSDQAARKAPAPKMDSLSMQVLARATATALLKHGLQKSQQVEAS